MPTVIIRFDETGELHYLATEGVSLYIVDERAPHDRVYEWTTRASREEIAAVLGDSEIGSANDARHAAIEAKIVAFVEGRPYLRPVD
jgi:hypothetical protein